MAAEQRALMNAARVARMMHVAMVTGVAIVVVVFAILRTAAPVPDLREHVAVFRMVGVILLLALGTLVPIVRRTIPSLDPAADTEQWWRAHLAKAIVVWALAEGTAIAGGVLWFLTDDAVLLALSGAALLVLVTQRPGVLAGQ